MIINNETSGPLRALIARLLKSLQFSHARLAWHGLQLPAWLGNSEPPLSQELEAPDLRHFAANEAAGATAETRGGSDGATAGLTNFRPASATPLCRLRLALP